MSGPRHIFFINGKFCTMNMESAQVTIATSILQAKTLTQTALSITALQHLPWE